MKASPVIGVLALQGAFGKHIEMLQSLGVKTREVRKPADLAACDALIIPGGESTTIMKQIQFIDLSEKLRAFAKKKPIFGTCAGLILMSHEIISDFMNPFQWLDISIERNAFGRQVESFQAEIEISLENKKPCPFNAVFIRAPRIRRVGERIKTLAFYENEPVLVQQDQLLGATFHPELTSNPFIHSYFLSLLTR